MKYSTIVSLLPSLATALVIEPPAVQIAGLALNPTTTPEKFLVELAPGETRLVTEEEKWDLLRNGQRFFDITDHADFPTMRAHGASRVVFPKKPVLQKQVTPLLGNLSTTEMRANLEKLTSFHTRFYLSKYGKQSSEWLLSRIRKMIADAGAEKRVTAEPFTHAKFPQNSIVVRIPGKTNDTVVVGAHQDSVNQLLPAFLAAPGADDDGSGTVTILEALRVLLAAPGLADGQNTNTLEFHWYAAEEGGLLGSEDIFSSYARQGRVVKAMLQQDMTGYMQGTLKAGKVESVGIIVDYVSPELTSFIKTVVVAYCDIPFVETQCGYACSDHASALKAGYPSAFVIESAFEDSNKRIHTTEDKIEYLSFEHMLQHARMTLGYAYELAFADFAALEATAEL